MDLRKNIRKADFVYAVLNIMFFLGSVFVFHACGPKDDGSWMTCHYAGNVISMLSLVLALISIVNIFAAAEIKAGLFIASLMIAIGTLFVPGTLVRLCSMAQMRCNIITKPCTTAFSIAIALCALVNLIFIFLKAKKNEISK